VFVLLCILYRYHIHLFWLWRSISTHISWTKKRLVESSLLSFYRRFQPASQVTDAGKSTLDPLAHRFTKQNSSILRARNSPLSPVLSTRLLPKSSKTPAPENLVYRSGRFNTHTHTKHKLIALSLCTAICILLCS